MTHRIDPAAGGSLLLWGLVEAVPLDQVTRLLSLLPPTLVGLAMVCRAAGELIDRVRRPDAPEAPAPDAPDAPPPA